MIWRPRHLTRSQREERRLEAGRLLEAGQLSHADIARRLGISRMAVSHWAQQLRQRQGDLASLHARPIAGRPARLSVEQWQRVLAVLKEGALKAGFDTDRWTLLRLRAVILVTFGVVLPCALLGPSAEGAGVECAAASGLCSGTG